MKAPKLEAEFDNSDRHGIDIARDMIEILEPFISEYKFDKESWDYTFLFMSRIIRRWRETNKLYLLFSEFQNFALKLKINNSDEYPDLSIENLVQKLLLKIEKRANKTCRKKTNNNIKRPNGKELVEKHILDNLRSQYYEYFTFLFSSGKYKTLNFSQDAMEVINQYMNKIQT